MASGSIGMSGRSFDAFVNSQRTHNEPDWAAKIQEKYWRARQKFLAKIEKNEDSCIVMSDARLDAKLEIYHSIDNSCARLTNILENYQNSLFMFANEENALGILLKECGKHDKTKAGKIMTIAGRGLTQSSHQRIRLYMPLMRLYQEMETFHSRAVKDTADTVDRLESSRSQYRASLLWMKDISEKLNPDIYKQLDKFRRVQTKVRDDKRLFDGMQMDVVQKIDLLMASRCNLMNQILAPYQAILSGTFERNHNNFKSIHDLIKNEDIYEYEFKTLKYLNPLKITDDGHTSPPELNPAANNVVEEDLMGTSPKDSTKGGNNNLSQASSVAGNLIDVVEGGEDGEASNEDDIPRGNHEDTLDVLESLFGKDKKLSDQEEAKDCGNKSSGSSSRQQTKTGVRERKLMQHNDLKTLMSSLDASIFNEESDVDKQIASLLGPSENFLKMDSQQLVDQTPSSTTADDDIFARWARDADIDLLGDERRPENSDATSAILDGGGNSNTTENNNNIDKNTDLMDLESTQASRNSRDKTRFYA